MADLNTSTEAWIAEFRAMQDERKVVDPFYEAASYHFDPLNAHYWCRDNTYYSAPKWNGDVMTGVGISSLNRLSTFLMGNGTPPASKWLDLEDENPDIRTQEEVAQFWSDATRTIETQNRGLPGMQSSFYIAMRDAYKSMGTSYGVVHCGEYKVNGRPTGHVFYEPVPSHAFWYRLGAHGELVSCAFLREMTDDQAKGFINRNIHKIGAGAGARLTRAMKSASRRQVLQMVKINRDPDPNAKSAADFQYQERWIDLTERETLLATGHQSQPFHVMGWNKIPGSHYFVGPTYDALADVTGATAARRAQLQALAWQGRPPLLARSKDGLDNPEKTLVPGRVTFGAINHEGKQMIQPLGSTHNAGVFQYAVADDEARVRELMMGNELLSQRRPDMTATEVVQVAQERAQMVAPFMITTMPAIKGMIARHFEILLRIGKLPPVPEVVAREGGFSANISGPMAIAARQADVGNIFQTLEQLQFAGQFDQTIIRRVNGEEVSDLIAQANGTISMLHSWGEVKDQMDKEAQMQAEAANAEIGKMQAGAAKDEAQALATVMQ